MPSKSDRRQPCGKKQIPGWYAWPHSTELLYVSDATHRPCEVIVMSSAPRPRSRVGFHDVAVPLPALMLPMPGRSKAVEPLLLHALLDIHRSWPPTYTNEASAATAYRESQPV